MKIIMGAILAVGCLNNAAIAGVIYNWQQTTASSTITSSAGFIEISDAAWQSGHIDFNLTCAETTGVCSPDQASAPITDFVFWVDDFDYAPVNVFPDYPSSMQASLDISNGELSGWLTALTFQSQVSMGGSNDWTIDNWQSDAGCFQGVGGPCGGATGIWVLDPGTVPTAVAVPEPGGVALFGFGLSLAGLAWRKRKAG